MRASVPTGGRRGSLLMGAAALRLRFLDFGHVSDEPGHERATIADVVRLIYVSLISGV